MDSRFAPAIKTFALGEANPLPWGRVNDYMNEPGESSDVRYGWRRLKEYFEVAAKYNEGHWSNPTYLRGIKIRGKRIPIKDGGIHWCGIFATYCWIRAGVPGVYWANPGIKGPNVHKIAGHGGIGIGDIAVLSGGLAHHCIVSRIEGNTVETINGNSDWQSVRMKQNRLSEIVAYYTVKDPYYEYLKKTYGN